MIAQENAIAWYMVTEVSKNTLRRFELCDGYSSQDHSLWKKEVSDYNTTHSLVYQNSMSQQNSTYHWWYT